MSAIPSSKPPRGVMPALLIREHGLRDQQRSCDAQNASTPPLLWQRYRISFTDFLRVAQHDTREPKSGSTPTL
jgi:hypothetical protein